MSDREAAQICNGCGEGIQPPSVKINGHVYCCATCADGGFCNCAEAQQKGQATRSMESDSMSAEKDLGFRVPIAPSGASEDALVYSEQQKLNGSGQSNSQTTVVLNVSPVESESQAYKLESDLRIMSDIEAVTLVKWYEREATYVFRAATTDDLMQLLIASPLFKKASVVAEANHIEIELHPNGDIQPKLASFEPDGDPQDFTAQSTPVMTRKQKAMFYMLTGLATLAILNYAFWWFRAEHIPQNWPELGALSFIFNAVYFGILTFVVWRGLLGNVFLWWVTRTMRKPVHVSPPSGWRAAVITCFVPGKEPYDMLENTLAAMTRVNYPHDTWVLDEGDDPVVKAMCLRLGVNHFSRKGIPRYNQPEGHFKAKTKGGNHNAWRDQNDSKYDFVAQMDMDYAPNPDYLDRTLGYFRDPKIAFVGSPQIYGNQDENFISKGSAEQAYIFYGPMQMGLYGKGMQLFIGANHVYRTDALNDIGGYSGHIVEDHLTGMHLYANGWKSVYVPEVLCIGEGPADWSAYLSQQMRWAYGLIDILFRHTPKLLPNLSGSQKTGYFFLQTFYFFGVAQLLGVLLILFYLALGWQAASMNFAEWAINSFPPFVLSMVVFRWLQRFYINSEEESGWHLRGAFLMFGAWPIYLWAFVSAVIGRRLPYAVTPKGSAAQADSAGMMLSQFSVHIALIGVSAVALVIFPFTGNNAPHLVFWAAVNTVSLGAIVFSHARLWSSISLQGRRWASKPLVNGAFSAVFAFSIVAVVASAFLFFTTYGQVPGAFALGNISGIEIFGSSSGSGGNGESIAVDNVASLVLAANGQQTSGPTRAQLGPREGQVAVVRGEPSNRTADSVMATLLDKQYSGVVFGAYDPYASWGGFGRITHEFVQFESGSGDRIRRKIEIASAQDKVAMISWEPRTSSVTTEIARARDFALLERIGNGEYDSYIRSVARLVRDMDEDVIMRFAHEMDLPNDGLHPWAGQSPELFITAHRRVVDIFRDEGADRVYWLWSPGGYFDGAGRFVSGDWYPGEEYVDLTGFTALLFWQWEESSEQRALEHWFPAPKEFIGPEYRALQSYGKPIILSEIGIDLHPSKKSEEIPWLLDFLGVVKSDFPDIQGLVYFNTVHNLANYDADWRLSLEEITALVQVIDSDPYFDFGLSSTETFD